MLNYNGDLLFLENVTITANNRAFKYGDAIFETIKVQNKKVVFLEDHYFRLMASMRMLRMKIPMRFTLEFLEHEILKTVEVQDFAISYRVRLTVYRKDGGLYTPETNDVDYIIEVSENNYQRKETYKVDLYRDFYNYSGLLSTIKTTNRMLNTIAGVYAAENDLDNCVLLNERKGVAETINANIFLIKDSVIKTPALTEGCIKGIIRKKVIEIIQKHPNFTLEETVISPFEIQKVDEFFITNAIVGIQPVTQYKKREFSTEVGKKLSKSLQVAAFTGKI